MNSTPMDKNDSNMTQLPIFHHGCYYHFHGYPHERLADAAAHARLVGARRSQQSDSPSFTKVDATESPDVADRQLMRELSISFEKGSFVFAGFHYDLLIDAANYARHRRQLGLSGPNTI